jgi:hypothetical protein
MKMRRQHLRLFFLLFSLPLTLSAPAVILRSGALAPTPASVYRTMAGPAFRARFSPHSRPNRGRPALYAEAPPS